MEKVARKADSIFAQGDEQMLRALSLLESWTAKYRPGSGKASMSSRRVLVDGRMVSHRSLKSLRTIERGGMNCDYLTYVGQRASISGAPVQSPIYRVSANKFASMSEALIRVPILGFDLIVGCSFASFRARLPCAAKALHTA